MKPGTLNLIIYQGATFRKSLVWSRGEAPVDLTGAEARLQVRKNAKSDAVLLEMTTANGGLNIPATPLGTLEFHLSATATSALTFLEGEYQLEVEEANGDVTRLLVGTITVDPELTR